MIKAEDIARTLGAEIQGDGKVVIKGMRAVAFAQEGDLTFAMDEGEMKKAAATKAACVMTTVKTDNFPKTVLYVKDMKGAMTAAYNLMERTSLPPKGTIHPTAIVDKTAAVGKNVSIGAHATIGRSAKIGDNSTIGANSTIGDNVSIGDFTRIYPNVSIYDYSSIGSKVIIHSGAVIGADGFGFIPGETGLLKVPQMGRAVLEDEVEIGANSCVDRGTFTDTVVGRGTKIDNLVQVAHNVKIGRNVIMAGQSGIAGSSTIGDNTMVGGQVGISDHVNIGRNTKIAAQSGVTKNTRSDNTVLFGYPARNLDEWIEHNAFSRWLFRHSKKLKSLLRED